MNIVEAIKELEEPEWPITEYHTERYSEAIQLGVEALKRIKASREHFSRVFPTLLPGETRE